MRKNREVWWSWKPSSGRDMHRLQVDIARRAASLVRPGGHVVVSTCSLTLWKTRPSSLKRCVNVLGWKPYRFLLAGSKACGCGKG